MNGTDLATELQRAGFRGGLRPDEPLAGYTTWRVGGPADLVATPADVDDLARAVVWADSAGVAWRVLGNGSNLLVRDDGVRGLVLRVRRVLDRIELSGRSVTAGAGASFAAVARQAARHGLAGLEFGAGIPGTIGGAVVMNAGWHEFEIGAHVRRVHWMGSDGAVSAIDRDACAFGYRGSWFRGRAGIVLSAELDLVVGDPRDIETRLERFAASRKDHQPTELASCGSVFLKPPGDFAGRLIEAAGLKGARVGDMVVSAKHANFFVNLGRAKAADALQLVERVEREVEARFGVRLVREFELW